MHTYIRIHIHIQRQTDRQTDRQRERERAASKKSHGGGFSAATCHNLPPYYYGKLFEVGKNNDRERERERESRNMNTPERSRF
jgi:hypothetical protein